MNTFPELIAEIDKRDVRIERLEAALREIANTSICMHCECVEKARVAFKVNAEDAD